MKDATKVHTILTDPHWSQNITTTCDDVIRALIVHQCFVCQGISQYDWRKSRTRIFTKHFVPPRWERPYRHA